MSGELAIFLLKFLGPITGGTVATISDVRERRIPNWLSVTVLVTGLLFQLIVFRLVGLGNALSGAALGFSVLFVVYAIGGGGAGDVKFMTGVGAWLGPYHTFMVFVMSALLLGMFAVLWGVIRAAKPKPNSKNTAKPQDAKSVFRARIPYAVPLTISLLLRMAWMLLIGRTS